MGLKNPMAFLIEREKPCWSATKDRSSGWSGGVPKGKSADFSGTLRGRRAGSVRAKPIRIAPHAGGRRGQSETIKRQSLARVASAPALASRHNAQKNFWRHEHAVAFTAFG